MVILGLLWPLIVKSGLGRLPGDMMMRRDNMSFYFPLTSCLLLSIAVSGILWLLRK